MSSVMESVKMPKTGARAPVKKKQPRDPNKAKEVYCILCRKMYWKHDAQDHMHSLLHHHELDTAVGNGAFHECHACKVSAMDLNAYGQHILTTQHNANLQSLKSKNVKAVPLQRTLSTETINKVLERNKQLKNIEKKATKKKKKKQKQVAAQQQAGDQQTTASITPPTVSELRKSKMAQAGMLRPMQETQRAGINTAVAQNKENRGSSVQRPFYPPGSFSQVQSETLSDWPSEIWHQAYYQGLCTLPPPPPPPQLRYNEKFAVNKQCNNTNIESKQTDRVQTSQGGATNRPEPISEPSVSYQYNTTQDKDFTNDQLPQSGAIIFGRSTPSPQPSQESSDASARPALSNKSANGAPLQDVDISSMLKHIRRVLGIREPCRAEREARKRSIDDITERTGPAMKQPVYMSSEDHVTSTPTTSSPSAQLQQMSFKGTPEQSQSEHMLYNSGKVRIAHKPGKGYPNTDPRLRPTLNKLLSLSGAKDKLNWTQMRNDLRKKQVKGLHRFGLEMMKHPADQCSLTQSEDSDLPLSEGFHWETLPGSPRLSLLSRLPGTTGTDDPTEEESDYQTVEHVEQPASSQQSCSSPTEAGAIVKRESSFVDEEFGDNSHQKRKRFFGTDDGVSENKCKRKKKKKAKRVSPNLLPGQDRMDQLLSVSLREEELSYTLQDLDSSLIQARNTLQAAYAEVQRIMLMKQQCAVEVNSLRAKRIEILQDMQEELSGLSHTPETAATSSGAMRPPSLPSSDSVPSSSSQPTSATTPASPFAQLQPAAAALSIKKEMCNLPTTRPPSHNADPDPPPSVTLTGAAQQHTAECSSSANTPPQTESSAGQEGQELSKEEEACEEDLLAEDILLAQRDSEEEIEENVSTQQAIAEMPLEEENIDDKGNESDNSVEMIHSKTEIIAIEESDHEELAEANSNVPAETDEPQESVCAVMSSEGTQTALKCDVDRKIELKPVTANDGNAPGESAEGEQPSVGQFLNHTGPVNSLQIHDGLLYTCSGDNTARAYCLVTRECKSVFVGHTNKINCLLVSSLANMPTRLYTGASDQTVRAFSIRSKKCLEQISLPDRVLCLHIAWNILYVGLASGSVFSYDLKTLKELDVFECHGPRGVSCMGTAQEGARRLLLVGSYDSTISVRDAKSGLLLRSLEGHTKTVLCMKVVNDLIFSGSSDTSVHAHNIHTGELVRIYKGHGHAVTSIVILGKVMVTACLDKLVRVYELQSHDRLQVYGGHSDMVMCMAVHKSVIYTGCYDGSVQAAKLNLLNNYRCWWQSCSLIFGIPEHLRQHLTGDHTNPNLQMIKCRWRGCTTYFATQELIKEKLPEHMQKHVEDDSSVQP